MYAAHRFFPIAMALAGLALFGVMDGFMKSASIAGGAYAAMFWRSVIGVGIMVPLWLVRTGGRAPSRPALHLHLHRGAVVAAMGVLFFHGLISMPMAEAMALSFIAPLIALYLAALTLGEKISLRAVIGSVCGLLGVAIIAAGKFSGDYDAGAIEGLVSILVSAVLYAWNLILQRRQSQLAGPEEIALFQTLVIATVLAPAAWWLAPLPAPGTWVLLGVAAALAAGSLMLFSLAYARAEAQVLVPLEYTAFIWAALVGWLAFAEPLTLRTLIGATAIVIGCLIAARRDSDLIAAAP